jgi:hypothetical protein
MTANAIGRAPRKRGSLRWLRRGMTVSGKARRRPRKSTEKLRGRGGRGEGGE